MEVALGCDHAGYTLKEQIKEHLRAQEIAVSDFGTFCENSVDYPDIALPVVKAVREGIFPLGILICGTGIGMSIAANKHAGIRAALCNDPFSAHCAREHNDANILTLGARVIGPGLALEVVDHFIKAKFQGGRHQQRLNKIALFEN